MRLKLGVLAAALAIATVFYYSAATAPVTRQWALERHASGDRLVVLLGGSEGGFLAVPALVEDLEDAGYGVAVLAYFGFPGGPRHQSEIDIDAIAQALEDVGQQHRCLAVVGVSKGAELALVLAAYTGGVDATVAMVPSHVVWQSSQITPISRSSWRLAGEPMEFVPYPLFSRATFDAVVDPEARLQIHRVALEAVRADTLDRAVIPVERIAHPVLLQAALHDQVWPSYAMARAVIDRADRLNPEHRITLSVYSQNHYLLASRRARDDLMGFLETHLADCP